MSSKGVIKMLMVSLDVLENQTFHMVFNILTVLLTLVGPLILILQFPLNRTVSTIGSSKSGWVYDSEPSFINRGTFWQCSRR